MNSGIAESRCDSFSKNGFFKLIGSAPRLSAYAAERVEILRLCSSHSLRMTRHGVMRWFGGQQIQASGTERTCKPRVAVLLGRLKSGGKPPHSISLHALVQGGHGMPCP
jgi:hypothetical protein